MQSAMAGTQARKEKVQKEQTLAGTERLSAPTAAVDSTSRAELNTAKQLADLGGAFTVRAQQLVNNTLQAPATAAATVTPQVDQTALGGALGLTADQLSAQKADPASNYNKASQALVAYSKAPSDPKVQASTTAALTAAGLAPELAAQLLQKTATAVGATAQQAAGTGLTIGQVDLKGIIPGVNTVKDLSTLLNVDEATLKATSIDQIDTLIQSAQQQKAALVDSIRAQITTLPEGSAQRAILVNQLQGLEMSGVGEAERAVKRTVQELNLNEGVKIGDQTFTVDELFKDQGFSDLVQAWIEAPSQEDKDALIPPSEFPELTQWLASSQQAIGELTSTMTKGVETAQVAEQAAAEVSAAVPAEVMKSIDPAWNPDAAHTAAEVAATQAKYDASVYGQLDKAGDTTTRDALLALPLADQKTLAKLPVKDVQAAFTSGQLLTDPQTGAALSELSGVSSKSSFITDKATRDKLALYKSAMDTVVAKGQRAWLDPNSPDGGFAVLKTLTPADISRVANHPERMDSLKAYNSNLAVVNSLVKKDSASTQTAETLMDRILGTDKTFNIADLNEKYKVATRMAAVGDKTALETKKQLETLFGFSADNPSIGLKQVERMKQALTDHSASATVADIVNGKAKVQPGVAIWKDQYDPSAMIASPLYSQFSKELKDSQLSADEMTAVLKSGDPALVEALPKLLKGMPDSKELLATYDKVSTDYKLSNIAKDLDSALITPSRLEFRGNRIKTSAEFERMVSLTDSAATMASIKEQAQGWIESLTNSAIDATDPVIKAGYKAQADKIKAVIAAQEKLIKDAATATALAKTQATRQADREVRAARAGVDEDDYPGVLKTSGAPTTAPKIGSAAFASPAPAAKPAPAPTKPRPAPVGSAAFRKEY
jgi:hypothetical protein